MSEVIPSELGTPGHATDRWRQILFDSNPLPVWIYDLETFAFLAVNDAAVAHYGYSHEEFLRMKVTEIRPPEEVPRLLELLTKLQSTVSQTTDWRHRKKDGTVIDVEVISHAIDYQGRRARIVIANDISERRRAEQALAASEENYRTIFDSASDAIFIHDPKTGAVLDVNQKALEYTGYSREELVRPNLWEITGAGESYTTENALRMINKAANGEPQFFEWKSRRKSGQTAWLEVDLKLITVAGKPRLMAVVHDITERRKMEETLRFTQFGVDRADIPIFWVNADYRFVYVNQAACRSVGYSREELLDMSVPDINPDFPPDQLKELWQKLKRLGSVSFEGRLRTKAGRIFPTDSRLNLVVFEGKEYICGFAIDITERKQIEQEVQASEHRLRALVEKGLGGITVLDREGRVIYDAPTLENWTGFSPEDMMGRWVFDLIHPEDRGRAEAEFRALAQTAGETRRLELRMLAKDGSSRLMELVGTNLLDDPAVHGVVVNSFDITERKRMEQKIGESEESYRLFAESIPVPAWRTDEKGGAIYCNRSWYEYTGQTPEGALGMAWTKAVHPDDSRGTQQAIARSIAAGGDLQTEYRLRRHDGVYRWHLVRAHPSRDSTGRFTGWFGTSTDVHDQRMAREELERLVQKRTSALRDSEERYRSLLELAPAGITVVVDRKIAFANTEFARIVGSPDVASLIGRTASDFAHPDSRELSRQRLDQLLDNRQAVPLAEMKLLRPNGEVRDVFVTSRPISYEGKPAALGVMRDNTEFRRLEHEIAEVGNRERTRIGQDLHDSVCQQLAGTALACQALQDDLARHSRPLAAQAEEIKDLIEKALTETRGLAQGLSPVELQGNDLEAALQHLAWTTSRLFAVKCTAKFSDPIPRVKPEHATHLYRIAQEAINNAIRHGKAKNIRLDLRHRAGRLTLTVRDNGTGISQPGRDVQNAGMGLPIMRYRAEQIGATFTVERAGKGRGTIVKCSLPLPVPPAKTRKPAR